MKKKRKTMLNFIKILNFSLNWHIIYSLLRHIICVAALVLNFMIFSKELKNLFFLYLQESIQHNFIS